MLPVQFFAKLRAKGQSEVLKPLPISDAIATLKAKASQTVTQCDNPNSLW